MRTHNSNMCNVCCETPAVTITRELLSCHDIFQKNGGGGKRLLQLISSFVGTMACPTLEQKTARLTGAPRCCRSDCAEKVHYERMRVSNFATPLNIETFFKVAEA